jgi:nucleoid DNA-binding protein
MERVMSKQEIAAIMQEKADLESRAQAERVYDAILLSMQDALAQGQSISIREFGTFSVTLRAARQGRNPRTGEALDIPAQKTVRFAPGARLKEAAQAVHEGKVQDWLDYRAMTRDLGARLDDLKGNLNAYKEKVDSMGSEAKATYEEQVRKLGANYDDVRARLKKTSTSGLEAWRELLHGLEKASGELGEAFKRAWEKF